MPLPILTTLYLVTGTLLTIHAGGLMMTVAAVDRLVHHGTIFEIKSDSYRRQAATERLNNSPSS